MQLLASWEPLLVLMRFDFLPDPTAPYHCYHKSKHYLLHLESSNVSRLWTQIAQELEWFEFFQVLVETSLEAQNLFGEAPLLSPKHLHYNPKNMSCALQHIFLAFWAGFLVF